MSRRISPELSGKINEIMFNNFDSNNESEVFLKKEMERYAPQFTKWSEEDISDFVNYQRDIWLSDAIPNFGTPIACLNPTFVDSVDSIAVKKKELDIYTRASEKENGYRFQLHNSPKGAKAFTRQFTAYDLKMFPELKETFEKLPVMVGDSELINKRYEHLAGFNRVNRRIPNVKYWPTAGTESIETNLLEDYLADDKMFVNGFPNDEYEMTLAFHGMFAIASPDTWDKPKEVQLQNMISLCSLPMNYKDVDSILDQLDCFIQDNDINAKVVERQEIKTKQQLRKYVDDKNDKGLEGSVIVQYATTKEGIASFENAKSIKIKKYETIDTAILGLYLGKKEDGLKENNIKGALLGLYDDVVKDYLPVCKVNLDPEGVQIKTKGQKNRLNELRKELTEILYDREDDSKKINTLNDTYMTEGVVKLSLYLGNTVDPDRIEPMFNELPRGKDIKSLINEYSSKQDDYDAGNIGVKKSSTKKDKWIHEYKDVLGTILSLYETSPKEYNDLMKYFNKYSQIKTTSKKLVKPQYKVDTSDPVIVETQVFDIKWAQNPMPAGFHSWYCDSFKFNNCFAELVRHDKSNTTDYSTIYGLARNNTVRK